MLPKSGKGKARVLEKYIRTSLSFKGASRSVRSREFEEHVKKHYERIYGKRHVRPQHTSRTTRKRTDLWIVTP